MESRRTTNDGRGKKKRIRWRGGSFVPVGNHLLFRRGSPIQKKLSNPAVFGEVFVLCLIWTLDGGEERIRRVWIKKRPCLAPSFSSCLLSPMQKNPIKPIRCCFFRSPFSSSIYHPPFSRIPFPPSPDHFLPLRPAFLRLCAQGAKICLEARTQRTSFPFICSRRRRKRENVLPPLRSL